MKYIVIIIIIITRPFPQRNYNITVILKLYCEFILLTTS